MIIIPSIAAALGFVLGGIWYSNQIIKPHPTDFVIGGMLGAMPFGFVTLFVVVIFHLY